MMLIHPADALLLAKHLHRDLVARADAFRHARRASAVSDCLIPVTAAAAVTQPCRPDPRQSAVRSAGRHRSRHAARHGVRQL